MKSDGQHILFSIIMIYDSKNKLNELFRTIDAIIKNTENIQI